MWETRGKTISCRDNPVARDRISGSVKCNRVRVAVKCLHPDECRGESSKGALKC